MNDAASAGIPPRGAGLGGQAYDRTPSHPAGVLAPQVALDQKSPSPHEALRDRTIDLKFTIQFCIR